MDRSTADGLAGGGALLAAASLVLPWYAVRVDGGAAGLAGVTGTLSHESGWDALASLHWVVLLLALMAGLRVAQPAVTRVGAVGLVVIVGLFLVNPPGVGDALVA